MQISTIKIDLAINHRRSLFQILTKKYSYLYLYQIGFDFVHDSFQFYAMIKLKNIIEYSLHLIIISLISDRVP